MNQNRFISIFILLVLNTLCAQNENEYSFEYLSTKEGLSHNFATSIVSDDLNNKWIGTENGITKTNGNNLEYIKPPLGFEDVGNENIETLFRDHKNRIWIGTKSGGISYIDPKYGSVKSFNHVIDLKQEGDLRITAITEDYNGNIWVGTWSHGFYVIDVEKEELVYSKNLQSVIFSMERANDKEVWVSYEKQIDRYNYDYKIIKTHHFPTAIFDFYYDDYRERLWFVGSSDNENLYFYDYNSASLDSVDTKISVGKYRKTLTKDNENRIWIGTWGGGIYRSNNKIDEFQKIKISPKGSEPIEKNYNIILSIHCDSNNQIWVGTANAGVIKLIPGKGFKTLTNIPNFNSDVFDGDLNITSIYKDEDKVFLGTLKSGVLYGSSFISLKPMKDLSKIKIFAFYRYENNLFIGAQNGFYIYDLKKQKITFKNLRLSKVTCFFIDQNEILYIGTQQNGMYTVPFNRIHSKQNYQIFRDNRTKESPMKSNRITAIQGDNEGRIWISTYNGLHMYDQNLQTVQHQNKLLQINLPSVITNSMHINNELIWLGTPSGLFGLKFEEKNNKLKIEKKLTQKDGLRNDFISSVTSDSKNNIWLSSVSDIIKYTPNKNSFTSYGKLSGVRTSSFNNRSVFNEANKNIFFGGMDNLTYFNPSKIDPYEKLPEVVFTSLRINNNPIPFYKDESVDKNFSYSESLVLKPEDDFFSIGFSVNDFLDPEHISFRYKLKGHNNEWIDLQNKNEINFAGLAPGNYQLEVSATRNNQDWSTPKKLYIRVKQSFWLTSWAFLFYAFLLSISVYYFVKFKKNQLKLKTDLEITKIEKQKDIALNEAKINFFTNISHEFRTPLTLIVGPVKELINSSQLDNKHRKKLSLVERNADKLLNLVNQLLDFRKAEHGLLKLNASEGNFVRFSKEVYLYFKELAYEKKIDYTFKSSKQEIRFPFDRNKLEIVLCNLISNAIKYSNAGDSIKIRLKQEDNKCIISIKDSGIGMSEENLGKIFNRFFQIKTAETSRLVGSGIGLTFSKKLIELHHGRISVKSKLGKGSKFTIKLEMDPNLYIGQLDDSFKHTDNMDAYTIKPKSYEPNLKNMNKEMVLIIDDNPDILTYLFDILQDDYDVRLADGGEKGLELALKEIPDLIVSDVMMPRKDGITLCKELKSNINTSHIPIILLTARTSTVFEIEGLNTGASDYISKPFNPTIVKARIGSILENQAKMKEFLANKIRFEPSNEINDSLDDRDSKFIKEAIGLVEDNLQNTSFGIDHMLEKFYMSQSTLYRKIKSLTGLSITAFIRSIRLKHAAELIRNTDRNMNEIAYDVGFNDYKYFKDSFKKQFQCLPSEYKKQTSSI
ncbi:two-component regulator propeller domain-containing protein [Galbibacter mesophilus]|uniref:two-component regulator propeller domain-containing protein n=1 Tax=Galbibacter mesophilus TaxID=379069 RepID=UPI00191F1F0E|nr:two-component regulator propeller domain-containing protein [Galbibacter mesophilus]MCM5664032.1 ATP-binding protein [Galbibacter mesophilus]